jgi:hypothetical protein
MYPDRFEWNASHFDRLCGVDAIRQAIAAGEPLGEQKAAWTAGCDAFNPVRQRYMLYGD